MPQLDLASMWGRSTEKRVVVDRDGGGDDENVPPRGGGDARARDGSARGGDLASGEPGAADASDDASDDDDGEDAGAAYERERDARIARNREIMRELGIDAAVARGVGGAGRGRRGRRDDDDDDDDDDARRRSREARRRAKAARAAAAATAPTRRSSRATRHLGSFVDDVHADAIRAAGARPPSIPPPRAAPAPASPPRSRSPSPETFDDSSVFRYSAMQASTATFDECRTTGGQLADNGVGRLSDDDSRRGASEGRRLLGFRETRRSFRDAACKKGFYVIDALESEAVPMLVAGGDGGVVAVFGLSRGERRRDESSLDDEISDECRTSEARSIFTLVPVRPRPRGERRFLRTSSPDASLRPPLAFNTRPRRLSTPTDAFQLHPDVRSRRRTHLTRRRRR